MGINRSICRNTRKRLWYKWEGYLVERLAVCELVNNWAVTASAKTR